MFSFFCQWGKSIDGWCLIVGFFNGIHRYDARDKYAHRPRHWSDENVLGKRAFFSKLLQNNKSSSGSLMIDNVHESDAGLYRCRVDFKRLPTRNSRVNLTVVGEWLSLVFPSSSFSSIHFAPFLFPLSAVAYGKWERKVWRIDDPSYFLYRGRARMNALTDRHGPGNLEKMLSSFTLVLRAVRQVWHALVTENV